MLTYKAMFKFLDEAVHAEVLDFPGVITCAANLEEARRLLASALVDMAETNWLANRCRCRSRSPIRVARTPRPTWRNRSTSSSRRPLG